MRVIHTRESVGTFVVDGQAWDLRITWSQIDGAWAPTSVEVAGREGQALTAKALRSITMADVMKGRQAVIGDFRPDHNSELELQGPSRAGRPALRDDGFVQLVADLYHQTDRRPWDYVSDALVRLGHERPTGGQLRNWYRRAVNLGLITP